MCPQYTDAPALGTSIKLCKPLQFNLRQCGGGGEGGGGGRLCTLDTFQVNKESKVMIYKAFCLQGQ